jgi:hypothetical protein
MSPNDEKHLTELMKTQMLEKASKFGRNHWCEPGMMLWKTNILKESTGTRYRCCCAESNHKKKESLVNQRYRCCRKQTKYLRRDNDEPGTDTGKSKPT